MKRPSVLAVTRRTLRKNKYIDYLGEYHLELLIRCGLLPVMVPVVEGTTACLPQYMRRNGAAFCSWKEKTSSRRATEPEKANLKLHREHASA